MITDRSLLNLMNWLSPSFPVGGYAYSHGIEFAVEDGRIKNEQQLVSWVEAALVQGSGRTDGLLFVEAWHATTENDLDRLRYTIELGHVWRSTSEMALENKAQGQAFFDTVKQTQKIPKLKKIYDLIDSEKRELASSVAVAIISAALEVPLKQALLAYYFSFSANLISAGVRLIPLGQIAGQSCIESLKTIVENTTVAAIEGDFNKLGSSAPIIDWALMKHETQYSRLFRS